jgi:hypothetical protein
MDATNNKSDLEREERGGYRENSVAKIAVDIADLLRRDQSWHCFSLKPVFPYDPRKKKIKVWHREKVVGFITHKYDRLFVFG